MEQRSQKKKHSEWKSQGNGDIRTKSKPRSEILPNSLLSYAVNKPVEPPRVHVKDPFSLPGIHDPVKDHCEPHDGLPVHCRHRRSDNLGFLCVVVYYSTLLPSLIQYCLLRTTHLTQSFYEVELLAIVNWREV